MRTHHRDQNDDITGKSDTHVLSTEIEISNLEECINEEYIDYEYIHSD